MNAQTIKGDWKQIKGQVREAFGKLTDDDLMVAQGNAEQLVGAIQKRYGYSRQQAEQAWETFASRVSSAATQAGEAVREGATRYDPTSPPHVPEHDREPTRTPRREL